MFEAIIDFFNQMPLEILMAYIVVIVAAIPVSGIFIWGFTQMWLDRKQDQYWEKLEWHLLQIKVPPDSVQTPLGMANFFNQLAGSKSSITWQEKWLWGKFQAYFSLEIVSNEGAINFYIRTQAKYRDIVEASFYAQYPEAQIVEVDDYIDILPDHYPDDEYELFGSEMVAKKDNFMPIKTWDMFEHQGEKDLRFKDPILVMIENLGKLRPGEHYWMQILIMQPDEQDWRDAGSKYINDLFGKAEKKKGPGLFAGTIGWIPREMVNQTIGAFFEPAAAEEKKDDYDWAAFKITPADKQRAEGIARKISSLGWYTKIRWVYGAKKDVFRKGSMAALTKGMFHMYRQPNMNYLGLHNAATPKDDYFFQAWQMPAKQRTLIKRFKNRSFGPGSTPYILNSEELASLFHFPPAGARTPVLTAIGARMAEAPLELNFAAPDEPDLPNLERTATEDSATGTLPVQPAPLAVPAPLAPTQSSAPAPVPPTEPRETSIVEPAPTPESATDAMMPQPGMPAPLPPGLDLSDEPMTESDLPGNLPT